MEVSKIIARFKDGSLTKGTSNDFSPSKTSFRMKPLKGAYVSIDMNELKAVFFVKDFHGDNLYKKEYKDVRLWDGNKIQVHFTDGEIIIGYTMHYDIGHHGFFVTPADLQSNNKYIFIITSATEKVTFI